MKNPINILIIDDLEVVANNLRNRLFKAHKTAEWLSQTNLNVFFEKVDVDHWDDTLNRICHSISKNEINYLLLDKGFFRLANPQSISPFPSFEKGKIYLYSDYTGEKDIFVILAFLESRNYLKGIRGAMIYTFNSPELGSHDDPNEIKNRLKNFLPRRAFVDCILTNTEVYSLANLSLFSQEPDLPNTRICAIGKINDLMLYGLFLGEILYHRLTTKIYLSIQLEIKRRITSFRRGLLVLFFAFTFLNLGANALYGLISKSGINDYSLFLFSFGFAFVLPLIILFFKPDYLIPTQID